MLGGGEVEKVGGGYVGDGKKKEKKKEKEGEVYMGGGEKRKEKKKKWENILRVHRRREE